MTEVVAVMGTANKIEWTVERDVEDPAGAGVSVVLTGTTVGVLGGAVADVLLLPASVDGRAVWVLLPADQAVVREQDSLDLLRRCACVRVDGAVGRVIDGIARERVLAIAAVLLGAEATGVASWCVATAAEYATSRVQFGRPIGQSQGVKHKCAAKGIELERARAAVWDAARALDQGDDTADFAAAVAAVVAPDAAVTR